MSGRKGSGSTGEPGVSFHKTSGRFRAYVWFAGKQNTFGYYLTVEEAKAAVAEARAFVEKFGELPVHMRRHPDANKPRYYTKPRGRGASARSGVPGVHYISKVNKFVPTICHGGRLFGYGYYSNVDEAAQVLQKAKEHLAQHGEPPKHVRRKRGADTPSAPFTQPTNQGQGDTTCY